MKAKYINPLKDAVFIHAFEKAEIANYDDKELDDYQQSLKIFRDNQNTFNYAKEESFSDGKIEGKAEGKLEVKLEVAKSALLLGLDIQNIMKLTGMTEIEILNIKNNI